jgi:hypothetical protein
MPRKLSLLLGLLPLSGLLAARAADAQAVMVPSTSLETTGPAPAFTPAPMPNRTLAGPQVAEGPATTSFSPTVFNGMRQKGGAGYPPQSSSLDEQNQRAAPIPGVNLKVPLQ